MQTLCNLGVHSTAGQFAQDQRQPNNIPNPNTVSNMVYEWEPETQYNLGDVVEYQGLLALSHCIESPQVIDASQVPSTRLSNPIGLRFVS